MNNNSDNNQNPYSNLGQQIKDIVSDAIGGQDYEKLNQNITKTVNSALEEARSGIRKGLDASAQAAKNAGWNFKTTPTNGPREFKTKPADYESRQKTTGQQAQKQTAQMNWTAPPNTSTAGKTVANPPAIPIGKVSNVASYAMIGGGISGLAIFGILLGVGGVLSLFTGAGGAAFALAFAGVGLAGSGTLLGIGLHQKNFNKRYLSYLRALGNRKFCEMKELAQATHQNTKAVAKDLHKMIKKGLFPEGYVDENQTQFIGTKETFQQYKAAKDSLAQRQEAQKQAQEAYDNMDAKTKEAKEAIAQGRAFIKETRQANDMIPGEEISKKLDDTEFIVEKIFDRIEERPDQLPEIRKFMQYYLPTTKKLIQAYKDFDGQPVQTDNIVKSKAEIEKTLDTINVAFYNLYNSLFQDEAMDVASDISVLHAMFAQEGLTKKDFTLEEDEKNEQ